MKAARVRGPGHAPSYEDVPEPSPAPGLVVADVRAASIKNIDRMLADGTHYDTGTSGGVPGVDGVAVLPDGRRVYAPAAAPSGMMAERALVDPRHATPVPDGVDDAVAAAVPNPGVSAWLALEHAGRIEPGQAVLVLGATGCTGALAVQLALTVFGADRVVAAGRSPERLARLRSWGATTLDLTADVGAQVAAAHAERPFDLVLDYLWGAPAEQTLAALGGDDLAGRFHRTRYVEIGEMAGPQVTLSGGLLRSAGIEIVGQGGGSIPRATLARIPTEILPRLMALVGSGALSMDVAARPLAEVTEAWTAPVPSGTRTVLVP